MSWEALIPRPLMWNKYMTHCGSRHGFLKGTLLFNSWVSNHKLGTLRRHYEDSSRWVPECLERFPCCFFLCHFTGEPKEWVHLKMFILLIFFFTPFTPFFFLKKRKPFNPNFFFLWSKKEGGSTSNLKETKKPNSRVQVSSKNTGW